MTYRTPSMTHPDVAFDVQSRSSGKPAGLNKIVTFIHFTIFWKGLALKKLKNGQRHIGRERIKRRRENDQRERQRMNKEEREKECAKREREREKEWTNEQRERENDHWE